MKNELSTKRFFNCMAFIGLIIAGVALIISQILGWLSVGAVVVKALNQIASGIAFVVTAVASFYYVRTKHSTVLWVIYVIAVLLVVVPLVIAIFTK